MSEIKVTTGELMGYARELNNIAVNYHGTLEKYTNGLNKLVDSCSSFSNWGFVETSKQIRTKAKDIFTVLCLKAAKLVIGVNAYESANAALILLFGSWLGGDVKVNTIGGSTEAHDAEQRRKEWERLVETKEQLPFDPNTGKDLGWCAGYAYARFNYFYPDCLPNPTGDAKDWLANNNDNPPLKVDLGGLEVLKNIKTPCIAAINHGNYGHVLIIEGVTFNKDGSIKDVYWSESNGQYDTVKHPDNTYYTSSPHFTEGYDGVMNKYSFDSGEDLPWVLREIDGFIWHP